MVPGVAAAARRLCQRMSRHGSAGPIQDRRAGTMATIKSLLDHVCTGGVLKIGDLAQVTRTTRRNVVRWRYRSATVRRDVEERLLELRARRRPRPPGDARPRGANLAALAPTRTRRPEAARPRVRRGRLPRDRRAGSDPRGRHRLTSPGPVEHRSPRIGVAGRDPRRGRDSSSAGEMAAFRRTRRRRRRRRSGRTPGRTDACTPR